MPLAQRRIRVRDRGCRVMPGVTKGNGRGFVTPGVMGFGHTAARFASRRRATRPAAAAPNSSTIGGAGTGAGLPLLLPPGPQCPYLHPPGPLDVHPPLVDQPFELEP